MPDVSMLHLRPVREDDADVVLAAHAELAAEGYSFLWDWRPGDSWSSYLDRLALRRHGTDRPPDLVPATFLVAQAGGHIVGRASIRHVLDDVHAAYGGHIGYSVLARHRRRGYATEILRQALVVARAAGVERVLVTCDHGNVGSATVIERAGGVFLGLRSRPDGVVKRRYEFVPA